MPLSVKEQVGEMSLKDKLEIGLKPDARIGRTTCRTFSRTIPIARLRRHRPLTLALLRAKAVHRIDAQRAQRRRHAGDQGDHDEQGARSGQ